jgi:hypothetical protein
VPWECFCPRSSLPIKASPVQHEGLKCPSSLNLNPLTAICISLHVPFVCLEDNAASEHLSLLDEHRVLQQAAHLVPVGEGLGRRRGQPDGGLRADESHVEPECEAVYGAGLQHGEGDGDVQHVQVRLVRRAKVHYVFLRARQARADVKCVLQLRAIV